MRIILDMVSSEYDPLGRGRPRHCLRIIGMVTVLAFAFCSGHINVCLMGG
ncbi:hypothetical protein [Desulfocicer vacuolatum]|nr:hypothetical protein [Desulfocicer vacuolatum]